MRNVLKREEDLTTVIADAINNSTKKGLRQVTESGQSTMNKGLQVARDLQDSSVVKYAQNSPVKTAGLIILGGVVVYSLYASIFKKRSEVD